MYHLLYLSSATKLLSDSELVEMLVKTRAKNLSLGITGMLLYKDGNVLQVLEGDKDKVIALFKTIIADQRHRGIEIIIEEEIDKPVFKEWSMGFRNLSDPKVQDIPGYSKFMNLPLEAATFKDDPSGAIRLLNLFKKN
jgi:acylphosphatase